MTTSSISLINQLNALVAQYTPESATADTVFNIFSCCIQLQKITTAAETIHTALERIDSSILSLEQQAALASQDPYTRFADGTTSPFSLGLPCKFEFGKLHYENAEACYQAQKYTDQPEVMKLFTECKTADEAIDLARQHPMTARRTHTWNNPKHKHKCKNDVLMHVQRAKFGQNPDLKNQLLATCSTYIVCHCNNPHRGDAFDGTGANTLGICLMNLRKEYKGKTGCVTPSVTHQILTQDIKRKTYILLHRDIAREILKHLDPQTFLASFCVCKSWNAIASHHTPTYTQDELLQICHPRLTILDAKAQGRDSSKEPPLNNHEILKWVKVVAPQVENDAGLTLLTMFEEDTLNEYVKTAAAVGMTVTITWPQITVEQGDIPVGRTYRAPLTNNVMFKTRNKAVAAQQQQVGYSQCGMPSLQEYSSLCVNTYKVFLVCLYGQKPALTYGRTSTKVGDYHLVVGGCASSRLAVYRNSLDDEDYGAGGGWKFLGLGH